MCLIQRMMVGIIMLLLLGSCASVQMAPPETNLPFLSLHQITSCCAPVEIVSPENDLAAKEFKSISNFHPDYERGNQADLRGKRGRPIGTTSPQRRQATGWPEDPPIHWRKESEATRTRGRLSTGIAKRPRTRKPRGSNGEAGRDLRKGQGIPRDDVEVNQVVPEGRRACRRAATATALEASGSLVQAGRTLRTGPGCAQGLRAGHSLVQEGRGCRVGACSSPARHLLRTRSACPPGLRRRRKVVPHGRQRRASGGQYRLALLYQRGLGVPLDHAEAVKLLQRAATSGHGEALYALGLAYEEGLVRPGTPRPQPSGSSELLRKATMLRRTSWRARRGPRPCASVRSIVPMPPPSAVPDDVRALVDDINRELTPHRYDGGWGWSGPSPGLQKKIRAHGAAISSLVQPLLRGMSRPATA